MVSCILRRFFNKDSRNYSIPAGLLAGLMFIFFPDNSLALYIMWKSLQVSLFLLNMNKFFFMLKL